MQFKTILSGIFLFLAILLLGSGISQAAVFNITESMPNPFTVEFSVSTDYTDVIGFVVGNDKNFGDSATTPGSGWESQLAYKPLNDNKWYLRTDEDNDGDGLKDMVLFGEAGLEFDLNAVKDGVFDTDAYSSAFVFFTLVDNASPITETEFRGLALPDSHFAAFRKTGDVLLGETTVTPVPGAGILLFSGLAGLVGIRRKQR